MKLSIASYSFAGLHKAGLIDLFGYFESTRYRYRLDAVDVWSGMLDSLEPDYLDSLKAALEERELTLAMLTVDGPHLWEDDEAARGKNRDDGIRYLEAAERLGARAVRIDAGARGYETFTDAQFDYIVKRYRELAARAHDGGYRIGPENHFGPEVSPGELDRLCEAVDHPGFGVLVRIRDAKSEAAFAPWAMHAHLPWNITEGPLSEAIGLLLGCGYDGTVSTQNYSKTNEYAEVAVQLARVKAELGRRALPAA